MRKFKNFIPLNYQDKERVKSQFRIKKIIKLLLLINLVLLPIGISNVKAQVFNKEDKTANILNKSELISLEKIGVLMDKAKELNSEIKINNNKFIIRTSNLENNDAMFLELYKNKSIKIESVEHSENYDEIKGVLNE